MQLWRKQGVDGRLAANVGVLLDVLLADVFLLLGGLLGLAHLQLAFVEIFDGLSGGEATQVS